MDIARRLKTAREERDLTQLQVAKETGLDNSTISNLENGRSEPRLVHLSALADFYHLPVTYFFREEEPKQELVLWRNKPSEEKLLRAKFLELCRQYHLLELWTDSERESILPKAKPRNPGCFTYQDAENFALEARRALGLGDRPGVTLKHAIEEKCYVKIFHMDLGLSGSAASIKSTTYGAGILLHIKSSQWRRNFDLAHELFHIMTWDIFRTESTGTETNLEEKYATCFASHLLLPSDEVRKEINKIVENGHISFHNLDGIAREFDVSLEALLWRMHFLYGRQEDQTKQYIEQSKKYLQTAQREDDSNPTELPQRYRDLAWSALDRGQISLGRFAKFMNISRREAQKYLSEEMLTDVEIPTSAA